MCECPHAPVTDSSYQVAPIYSPSTYTCSCPKTKVPIHISLTDVVMNLTLGLCACPRGIRSDPSTQSLLTYGADFQGCRCPYPPTITNPAAQLRQIYDRNLMYCICYSPPTGVVLTQTQWALVWNRNNNLCECPKNSIFNSNPTKYYCECTTAVDPIPAGTVKPTVNVSTGNCQCPTGTTFQSTSKVCVCTTGSWNTGTSSCA